MKYQMITVPFPCFLRPLRSVSGLHLNQLMEYMSQKECLTEHQSGNKKLHSTETLIILVSDMILEAMNRKEFSAVVLLHLSKAFDSTEHTLLFKKLHAMGVSKKAVDWFKHGGLKVTSQTDLNL